jgi:hypothetical protein
MQGEGKAPGVQSNALISKDLLHKKYMGTPIKL